MLRRRVIPCLDVANGRVVKGTRFVDLVDAGDPPELAERYARDGRRRARVPRHHRRARGPRRPCSTSSSGPRAARSSRSRSAAACAASTRCATSCGPARTRSASTRARSPIRRWSPRARRGSAARPSSWRSTPARCRSTRTDPSGFEVVVKGGRESTGLDAIAWAARAVELGAGELLVTSIDRDGTKSGFDTAAPARDHEPGRGPGHRVRRRVRSGRLRDRGGRRRRRRRARRRHLPPGRGDDRRGQGGDGRGRAPGARHPAAVPPHDRRSRRAPSTSTRASIPAAVAWGADGLVAGVVQDVADGRVLMVGWLDAEALAATLAHRRGALPLALARHALAQGRDVGQRPAAPLAGGRLRRRRAAARRGARRPDVPPGDALLLRRRRATR